jgi:indolepyruvate ferredoxin oxidoreductase beta subunit
MSEIHGLAQRGGSVSVDVRIGDYYAPMIPDGDADLVIGLEPLEAERVLTRAGPGTKILMSREKMAPISLGIQGKEYPDVDQMISEISRDFVVYAIDAITLARKAGNARTVNVVVIGFMLGLGLLEIPEKHIVDEMNIMFPGKLSAVNLKALELGKEAGKSNTLRWAPVPADSS